MLNKLELTKRIRKISSQLDGYINAHGEIGSELSEIHENIRELEDGLNTPPPKTIEEAMNQYQQHARDQFIQQSEFLKTLQNLQQNIT